jgi:hypothetical protein
MPRKTIEVTDILEYVNHNLNKDHHSDEVKSGLRAVLEHVLFATGNYHGFSHNDEVQNNSVTYGVKNHLCLEYRQIEREREKNGGLR